jgi:hypothetical protein
MAETNRGLTEAQKKGEGEEEPGSTARFGDGPLGNSSSKDIESLAGEYLTKFKQTGLDEIELELIQTLDKKQQEPLQKVSPSDKGVVFQDEVKVYGEFKEAPVKVSKNTVVPLLKNQPVVDEIKEMKENTINVTINEDEYNAHQKMIKLVDFKRESIRKQLNVPEEEFKILEVMESIDQSPNFEMYHRNFITRIKEIMAKRDTDGEKIHSDVYIARSLMKLYLLLRKNVRDLDVVSQVYKKIVKKSEQIRSNLFMWNLNLSNISLIQKFFSLANIVQRVDYLSYLPADRMAEIYPFTFFDDFIKYPLFHSSNNHKYYQKVLNLHSTMIATFNRVYLELPMSLFVRFEYNSLDSGNPFLRYEQRYQNVRFYEKNVELVYGFRLINHIQQLLDQFNSVEVPTWNFHFKPIVFVEILNIIHNAFEFGLIRTEFTEFLLEKIAGVCEIVLSQEVYIQKCLEKNQHKAQQKLRLNESSYMFGDSKQINKSYFTTDNQNKSDFIEKVEDDFQSNMKEGEYNNLLNNMEQDEENIILQEYEHKVETVIEEYKEETFLLHEYQNKVDTMIEEYKEETIKTNTTDQISRIKFLVSSILMQIMFLENDTDYINGWKLKNQGRSHEDQIPYIESEKKTKWISIILFKFLTKKSKGEANQFDFKTDFMMAELLKFIGGKKDNCFSQSLKLAVYNSIENDSSLSLIDGQLNGLVSKLNNMEEMVIFDDYWNRKDDITAKFEEIYNLVWKLELNETGHKRYIADQIVLMGIQNFFFRLAEPIMCVIGEQYIHSFCFLFHVFLRGNSIAKRNFLSVENYDYLFSFVDKNPIYFMLVLTKSYGNDAKFFLMSPEPFEVLLTLYKKLTDQLVECNFSRPKEYLIAVTALNHFICDIKKYDPNKKRKFEIKFGLIYCDYLVPIMDRHVFEYFATMADRKEAKNHVLKVDPFQFSHFDFSTISDYISDIYLLEFDQLKFELFYSFFRLFNQMTNETYSNKTYSLICKKLKRENTIKVYENTTGCFLVRAEELLLRSNFILAQSDKLIHCQNKLEVGEFFLNEVGFYDEQTFCLGLVRNEIQWLEEYLARNSSSLKIGTSDLEVYLFKGLFPLVHRLVSNVLDCHLKDPDKRPLPDIVQGITDVVHKMKRQIESIQSIIKNDKVDLKNQFIESEKQFIISQSVKVENQREVKNSIQTIFEKLKKTCSFVLNFENKVQPKETCTVDEDYPYQQTIDFLKKVASDVKEYFANKPEYLIYIGHLKNNKNLKKEKKVRTQNEQSVELQGIRKWLSAKQRKILKSKQNPFIKFLSLENQTTNVNENFAKFLIKKIAQNKIELVPENWVGCYFLNPSSFNFITFLDFALKNSKDFKRTVLQILNVDRIEEYMRDFQDAREEIQKDRKQHLSVKFIVKLRTLYLLLANSLFYRKSVDKNYKTFFKFFSAISSVFFTLTDSNPIFREVYNQPKLGQVGKLEVKIKEFQNSDTIFEEQFLITSYFLQSNSLWLIQNRHFRSSDSINHIPLLSTMLQDCALMINPSSKETFTGYYKLTHDVFIGILEREVEEKDSKLYELKWSIVNYLTECLESNDDAIRQMQSTYDIHHMIDILLNSIKELYAHFKELPIKEDTSQREEHKQRENQSNLNTNAILRSSEMFNQFSKVVITDQAQLINLYKCNQEFSNHMIIKVSFDMYSLLSKLAIKSPFVDSIIKEKEKAAKKTKSLSSKEAGHDVLLTEESSIILSFLLKIRKCVEVVADDPKTISCDDQFLTRVYFRKTSSCFYWSESIMTDFIARTSLKNDQEKKRHFWVNSFTIISELEHNRHLAEKLYFFGWLFKRSAFDLYNLIFLLLTIILNILMLIYVSNTAQTPGVIYYTSDNVVSIVWTAYLLFVGSGFVCLLYVLTRMKLEYELNKLRFLKMKDRKPDWKEKVVIMVKDTIIMNKHLSSLLIYLVFSCLGIFWDQLFFIVVFTVLINFSGDIQYIIKSIFHHSSTILWTILMMFFVTLSYTFLIHTYWANNFLESNMSECSNYAQCFVNFCANAFISGLDAQMQEVSGPLDSSSYWSYFFLVISYFIIIKLILLNLIISIIMESFGNKKEKFEHKLNSSDNICYICDNDRWTIQKNGDDFDKHRKKVHSLKHYFFFLVYLKSLNEVEENDFLDEISLKYENRENMWLPKGVWLNPGEHKRKVTGKNSERRDEGKELLEEMEALNAEGDKKADTGKEDQILHSCPNCGHNLN